MEKSKLAQALAKTWPALEFLRDCCAPVGALVLTVYFTENYTLSLMAAGAVAGIAFAPYSDKAKKH